MLSADVSNDALRIELSSASVLNCLLCIAPPTRAVPPVVGIDEFALRKGHEYATILIDAANGERIDVLPDRTVATVADWLREHPQARVGCRDRAGTFAQAATEADPAIVGLSPVRHLTAHLPRKEELPPCRQRPNRSRAKTMRSRRRPGRPGPRVRRAGRRGWAPPERCQGVRCRA